MLRASHLSFQYPSGPEIISDWNETFLPGELVAITGPSGRGKSTLMYLLGLMLTPTSGLVELDGAPTAAMTDRKKSQLRSRVFGFVFQDASLDPSRTVLDNVMETALYAGIERHLAAKRANSLLDEFGVLLRANARPGQVSGGQAQRIALCRALLNEPQILLADEPTGNLDKESADVVLRALRSRALAGSAVIVVTHDQSVTDHCDRQVQI
ncbi:ABC transporter ATP-binding protein [Paenarthrobacter sp. NPDC089989]|uniref:ABC transporter ATP-binding protein n=1 Tax=unclassified Paenarthrobacter TaxID=2634190 RepID=UPI003803B767